MRPTDIGMSKFVALSCVLLHLQVGFAEPECECKIHIPVPQKPEDDIDREALLPAYLQKFAELEKQELGQDLKCCRNYAEIFGDWAMDLCPKTIAEVVEEVNSVKRAYGGRSGVDVLLTSRFVIKQTSPHEIKSTDLIIASKDMAFQKGEKPGPSMLTPVCRKFTVHDAADPYDPEPKVYTVSPLVKIKDARTFPDEVIFDLKGNCKYSRRKAAPHGRTQKDVDFKEKFPAGLYIKDKEKREYFQEALMNDAKMLKENGLTDYSLLLHAVETAESVDLSEEGIIKANERIGKNLAFAISPTSNKTYAMSYILIDYLVHEHAKGSPQTHMKNTAAIRYSCSGRADCCGQNMPDPLDAAEYQSRLLMMIGHNTGADCLKRGGSYWTYFPNVMEPMARHCHEKDPDCKTLCEHLGLHFDKAANRCTKFENIFNKCRGLFHKLVFLTDAVSSSQSHIEEVMVSTMVGDDVMVAIEDIKRNMARQEMDDVKKYGQCHRELTKYFEAHAMFSKTAGSDLSDREL
jgi:hypothetical protein